MPAHDDDAATFARLHAGALEPDLTADQRDLLGRVIAKRIEQGAKLQAIARAAGRALAELGAERAQRLGRDETMRAYSHERLALLRAEGAERISVSAAADACPVCQEAAGAYPLATLPPLPHRACQRPTGCRCVYRAAPDEPPT